MVLNDDLFGDDPRELALRECEKLGGRYLPNYLSQQESDELYRHIDRAAWTNDLKRRVQQYGYRYDYRARKIDDSMKLGKLPAWSQPLAARLKKDFFNKLPQQLIVNEYTAGQGIAAHTDAECFGPIIVSVSLCSPAIMEFAARNPAAPTRFKILLEPRSAIVLDGDLRARWTHGLWLRKKDVANEYNRRVSLTFRTIADE